MGNPRGRILILSASVGAGHLRAAEALELAFKSIAPDVHVRNLDVLTLTNALFRKAYADAYIDLIKVAPHVLGAIYDLTDKPLHTVGPRHRLRALVQKLNLRKLDAVLDDEEEGEGRWDMIVNTHFLPADLIARRKRRGTLGVPQATVVTDFDAHAFWINQPTEWHFVASEEAALSLIHWGVPRESILHTGIPIHPVFWEAKTKAVCRRKHGLSPDRPVVLVLAGGFGVGPIETVYSSVLRVPEPAHVVVVCGRNAGLKRRIERTPVPARHRVNVLGYTTEMDELLGAADVVITKPGGLTTSETLARACPMGIISPIPGQESRNSDYLLEHGAAVKFNTIASLTWKLHNLLKDPARLAKLSENARVMSKPFAARAIARAVLDRCGLPLTPPASETNSRPGHGRRNGVHPPAADTSPIDIPASLMLPADDEGPR